MKQLALLFLITFCVGNAARSSDKDIETDEQLWLGFVSQWKLSKHARVWFDAHFRTRQNFATELGLAMVRPGFIYYVKADFRFSAGYAYAHHFAGGNNPGTYQPEHRPWQQAQWFFRNTGVTTMQWLRFEQRFRKEIESPSELGEGYDYSNRIRFNTFVTIPLNNKKLEPKTWFILINDEVFINFGKEITYNIFDQNRAFIGPGYAFSKELNIHVGYLNVFQQRASGNQYTNVHAIRFFVMYTPHFDKKKE